MKAQRGTEIVFPWGAGKKVRARVRRYSLGGVAFTPEENLALESDDRLQELSLGVPEEEDWFTVEIPLAAVRRVEPPGRRREGTSMPWNSSGWEKRSKNVSASLSPRPKNSCSGNSERALFSWKPRRLRKPEADVGSPHPATPRVWKDNLFPLKK